MVSMYTDTEVSLMALAHWRNLQGTCRSKTRYPSRKGAWRVIHRIKHRQDRDVHMYRCKVCNGWHLTSSQSGEEWNGDLNSKE